MEAESTVGECSNCGKSAHMEQKMAGWLDCEACPFCMTLILKSSQSGAPVTSNSMLVWQNVKRFYSCNSFNELRVVFKSRRGDLPMGDTL